MFFFLELDSLIFLFLSALVVATDWCGPKMRHDFNVFTIMVTNSAKM